MQPNEISANPGATKSRKRVGRGGKKGTFAGRGMNGQNSRSGGGKGPAFEGGQTPWYRRLPHYRGFKYPFRTEYAIVSLSTLDKRYDENETVDVVSLVAKNVIKNAKSPVKVLGNGNLSKALTVAVDAVSASAKEAIEKAGGKVEER